MNQSYKETAEEFFECRKAKQDLKLFQKLQKDRLRAISFYSSESNVEAQRSSGEVASDSVTPTIGPVSSLSLTRSLLRRSIFEEQKETAVYKKVEVKMEKKEK